MATPRFILEIAPIFRDWTSSAWPSWDELGRVADDVRGAVGISLHAWSQAWITLGSDGAITALAAICARHAAGPVKSPSRLLRKLAELHHKGTLRLDRTLFRLAEKAGIGQSDGRAARQARIRLRVGVSAPDHGA